MKTIHKSLISVLMALILLGLGGYAGMSTQEKNTAIGAGVGAVGGAAVGGVIGHEVSKELMPLWIS